MYGYLWVELAIPEAFLALFRPGFFEPSGTGGRASEPPPPPHTCYFKTVNAMITKLAEDDVDNNSSNFRWSVVIMT